MPKPDEENDVNRQDGPVIGFVRETNPVLSMLGHGMSVDLIRHSSMAAATFLSPRGPMLFTALIRASRVRTWAVLAFLEAAAHGQNADDIIDIALREPDIELLRRVIDKLDSSVPIHSQLRNCLNRVNHGVTASMVAAINRLLNLGHDQAAARRIAGAKAGDASSLMEVLTHAQLYSKSDVTPLAAHLCPNTYSLETLDVLLCLLDKSGCLPSGRKLGEMTDLNDLSQFLRKKLARSRAIRLPAPEIVHPNITWMRTSGEVRALGRRQAVCLAWEESYIWRALLGQYIASFTGLGEDMTIVLTVRVNGVAEILEAKLWENVPLSVAELQLMLELLNNGAPQSVQWKLSNEFVCEAAGLARLML